MGRNPRTRRAPLQSGLARCQTLANCAYWCWPFQPCRLLPSLLTHALTPSSSSTVLAVCAPPAAVALIRTHRRHPQTKPSLSHQARTVVFCNPSSCPSPPMPLPALRCRSTRTPESSSKQSSGSEGRSLTPQRWHTIPSSQQQLRNSSPNSSPKPTSSNFCLRDDRTPDGTPPKCGDDYKLPPLQAAMEANPLLKVFVSTWSAHPAFKEQNFECTVVDGMNYCTPSEQSAMECNTTVANPDTCDSTNKQGVPCPTLPPTHVVPKAVGVDNDTPIKNADGNCANTGFVKDQASWALQFKKFIDAYQNASVPIWGVTAQNEPLTQTGMWGSNFYTAQNETDFIVNHLSPTLRRAYPHIKIMSHDDQMPALGDRGLQVATDAGDHIDGIAFHWYDALEGTYEDGKPQSPLGLPHWIVSNKVNGGANVKTTYDALNGSKFLLMTEACSGYSLSTSWVGPRHGEWGYGYSTGHDIMWQLKNRAAGWVYWNLILDEVGGPNLAGNYVVLLHDAL